MQKKLCECGCGQETSLAKWSDRRFGWIKGEPVRFISGHNRRRSPLPYVVDPATGCWEWQRAKQNKGYGLVAVGAKMQLAHRVYYEAHIGPIPPDLQIDHLCGNRGCVNPHHLEPVTASENQRRGRNARLTKVDVELIRSSSLSGRKLARQLGVSHE